MLIEANIFVRANVNYTEKLDIISGVWNGPLSLYYAVQQPVKHYIETKKAGFDPQMFRSLCKWSNYIITVHYTKELVQVVDLGYALTIQFSLCTFATTQSKILL